MERNSMTLIAKAASLLPHRFTLHHKHLNHYCFMVKSIEINSAHTHNHEANDLSSKRVKLTLIFDVT